MWPIMTDSADKSMEDEDKEQRQVTRKLASHGTNLKADLSN